MKTINADKVRNLLTYDPDTGEFHWRVNRTAGVKAGDRAGRTTWTGYRQIMILNRLYAAHRLAWLYQYREWPFSMIDHVNGDRSDNRIANLRLATNSQNQANRKKIRAKSGVRGICLHPSGKWQAQIKVSGKNIYLGLFDVKADAARAYAEAAANHFGDYAA